MSVVAIKKVDGKWQAAADAIMVRWCTQNKEKDAKLNRVGEFIVGTAGSAGIGNLMFEYLSNHQPKTNNRDGWVRFMADFEKHIKAINTDLKNENVFLIIWKNKAWHLTSKFYVDEVKSFEAIGAGMDFALAALHLGHNPATAVGVACDLSIYCERPIKTLKE